MTYLVELAGVLIAVSDADGAAVDSNIESNAEVLRHEGAHTVGFEDHLTLEEGSLGNARVYYLGFSDHNALIFEEVEHSKVVNAVVFETRLDNSLLEVAGKTEHLYNK